MLAIISTARSLLSRWLLQHVPALVGGVAKCTVASVTRHLLISAAFNPAVERWLQAKIGSETPSLDREIVNGTEALYIRSQSCAQFVLLFAVDADRGGL